MRTVRATWAALILGAGVRGAEFHVAIGGDDANAGTAAAPLRSLDAARRAARAAAGREPVTVIVHAGTYYLPETFVLGPEDGGTAAAPVVYRAEREGAAVLSGGRRLDLSWSTWSGGIMRAKAPAAGPGDPAIDQLFLNGRLLPMARYPNYDASVRPYGGFAADAFAPARAARWQDPAGGFIHAMHRHHWGGYHYRIAGKNADGTVAYEGGWQNNRQMGMHPQHRFVENIFEELDAPGEWFHDAKAGVMYLYPPAGVDPSTSVVEVVRLRHLVEFRGPEGKPVRHVTLKGFVFRHAARTFMDTREPLLRSDWTIYRGGAVLFAGTEDCAVEDSEFDQLGGNAVFVDKRNRRVAVRGCHIHDTGASAVAFVGDPTCVRNPLFEYGQRQAYTSIDRTPGPQGNNFPAECVVEDCLIVRAGVVEKQATGVQISMSQGITLRHCSIYDMSRAGINISEGTFGGHVIEFCDVFDTVKETGDHGSFNSWGRDRYWGLEGAPPEELPRLACLDMVATNVLRNSRWRCDHGWDVDLDDGSSNYEIYNNLFLNGGLKLREGFHRRVWNNIAVNNGLHPHVWYDNSQDVVTNNIFMRAHRPAGGMPKGTWGKEIDRNFFTAEADRTKFAANGCDARSRVGAPMFVDPAKGDYRVRDGSPALAMGFVNFPMDQFGVQKPSLRSLAGRPVFPVPDVASGPDKSPDASSPPAMWCQAAVRSLAGEEFSAYGVSRESGGVVLVAVPPGSFAARAGLRAEDLVQRVNGKAVRKVGELLRAQDVADGAPLAVGLVRGQQAKTATVAAYARVRSESPTDLSFRELGLRRSAAEIRAVSTRPGTDNEPPATLHDGKLAANYGPVMRNGTGAGLYKADLGGAMAIRAVGAWSFNQNGNRGAQRFALYGSASATDPGWDVTDSGKFTPVASVDVPCGGQYLATRVESTDGQPLGAFRWLLWATAPVTAIGEHTAFQEFQVEPASPPGDR